MRKSSRGNPWHDEKGRFCHGPTATVDTWGNPISEEQRHEWVSVSQSSDEYYRQRTNERFGRDVFGFDVTEVNGNKHSNLKGECSSTYIRCGGFDRRKVQPVGNGEAEKGVSVRKPLGGVWLSSTASDFGWTEWCERNGHIEWNEDPVELEIHGAKILHIYDAEDMECLPHTSDELTDIDYIALSRHYDGIEVHIKNIPYTMYGWDCDSTVIFNDDVIQQRR